MPVRPNQRGTFKKKKQDKLDSRKQQQKRASYGFELLCQNTFSGKPKEKKITRQERTEIQYLAKPLMVDRFQIVLSFLHFIGAETYR